MYAQQYKISAIVKVQQKIVDKILLDYIYKYRYKIFNYNSDFK